MQKFILQAILIVVFSILVLSIHAQDDYHNSLINELESAYGISGGEFIFPNTEVNLLEDSWSYGADTYSTQDIANQNFSKFFDAPVVTNYNNEWESGWGITTQAEVSTNDALLLVFYARSNEAEDATVNVWFENGMTYEKELYYTINIDQNWRQFIFSFTSNNDYLSGAAQAGFHLGHKTQHIQFAGFNVINFKSTYTQDQLPKIWNNELYEGHQVDAPWRTVAQENIENLRMAPLKINVKKADGSAQSDVPVHIEMQQHEFAFGTAVVSCAIANNDCQDDIYQEKLLNLDGKGHGFNWVVFENGLKWKPWEGQWPTSQAEKAKAVQWFNDQNIKVRGHNLLWPVSWALPDDVNLNFSNRQYVHQRILDHLLEILEYPGIKGNIEEWDVMNEITWLRDIENNFAGQLNYVTGREIYAEVFEEAKSIDPFPKLYINDYVTIGQNRSGGETYDRYQSFIQEIIDAGAPLEGIGFQAHMEAFPTGMSTVKNILDDFYQKFGVEHKITEFDMDIETGQEVEAKYIRDFLTMVFSHESSNGFLMWGFWDDAHWKNNAPMFNSDWSLKPSGQAFNDLVFDEWWTDENEVTNSTGEIQLKGFKGTYIIKINCDPIIIDTINLTGNGITLDYECDLISASETQPLESTISIFPNPSKDLLNINWENHSDYTISIYNTTGQKILTTNSLEPFWSSNPKLMPGYYQLVLDDGDEQVRKSWIVLDRQ